MIHDDFASFHPSWVRFAIGHAGIEHEPGIGRLVVDGAVAGELSDAEIDDHRTAPRWNLKWTPPLTMSVRARFSHQAGQLSGTAGFGFWNDPFDWVGNVESPPNALWFFYASPHSDMAFIRGVRGSGWKAATLNGGRADRLTMALGNFIFRIPGMSKLVFRLAETRISAAEQVLELDMTEWHDYYLDWQPHLAVFSVDEQIVLRAPNPPTVPLGFVAWVDNNATTMGPGKDFEFKRIDIPARQWMELSRVHIEKRETV
ncbi:MAG: hypothetical protein ACM3JD_01200 [Rudaea sp.]